jgi:predicted small metal-binding protein
MSKIVRCREVGVDCDFEARGETEQEVLQQCSEHAKSAHGFDEIPAELAAKVRSSIRDEEPQKQTAGAS